ncbi:MAG: hypothetical protein V4543_00825 [Bacteroidota bacterium]
MPCIKTFVTDENTIYTLLPDGAEITRNCVQITSGSLVPPVDPEPHLAKDAIRKFENPIYYPVLSGEQLIMMVQKSPIENGLIRKYKHERACALKDALLKNLPPEWQKIFVQSHPEFDNFEKSRVLFDYEETYLDDSAEDLRITRLIEAFFFPRV